MAQKQKATGIITLLLFKKNIFSPFAIGLRTGIIYRPQTQTNKFLNLFVFLSLKCQVSLTFVMKITKTANFRQTWQISHSDVISILCCTLIF